MTLSWLLPLPSSIPIKRIELKNSSLLLLNNDPRERNKSSSLLCILVVVAFLMLCENVCAGESSGECAADFNSNNNNINNNKEEEKGREEKLRQAEEYFQLSGLRDSNDNCMIVAANGQCGDSGSGRGCERSCRIHEILNTELANAKLGIGYFDERQERRSDCIDEDDQCPEWAKEAECMLDQDYMLRYCRKSCLLCLDQQTEMFEFGVDQEINLAKNNDNIPLILANLQQTQDYMQNVIMRKSKYQAVRRDCFNFRPHCTEWAVEGFCEDDPKFMQVECCPSCRSASMLETWHRCQFDRDDTSLDALQAGKMDDLFQNILTACGTLLDRCHSTVWSSPFISSSSSSSQSDASKEVKNPWIITLDNFLTPEECDYLIRRGMLLGYQASRLSISSGPNHEGNIASSLSPNRTSTSAMCTIGSGCYNEPIVKTIRDRVQTFTGIPKENYGWMQIVKYEQGQFFRQHYDYKGYLASMPCGPRILTFFLYLSDVEEDGGSSSGRTHFPNFNLSVTPKQGRALVWTNVIDSDPWEHDPRMYHEAMTVEVGQKFGVNWYIHMRDYVTASENQCV